MKKMLLLTCLITVAIFSCKKDDIDNQSNKLLGTWEVKEIKAYNADAVQIGNLVFSYGTYQFNRDNSFTYTRNRDYIIQGKWGLSRDRENNCTDCSPMYEYGLVLTSEAINNNKTAGWFSEVLLNKESFTMNHYIPGINSRFEYTFTKKDQ